MFSHTQRFGSLLERYVASELRERGWSCRLMSSWFASFDLLVNDTLPIEVKAARPYRQRAYGNVYRDRWQFDLSRGLYPRQAVVVPLQQYSKENIREYLTVVKQQL